MSITHRSQGLCYIAIVLLVCDISRLTACRFINTCVKHFISQFITSNKRTVLFRDVFGIIRLTFLLNSYDMFICTIFSRFDEQALHYNRVIMSAMASQVTSLTIVYSTAVYSRRWLKEHQSSASLAFVRGIHRWPMNSQHKGPVTRKMFPFDDVIIGVVVWNIIECNILWHICCEIIDNRCIVLSIL